MAQISYTNKVALNENPEIADINKVTDDDMNEIKQVVNDNYNNTIVISDTQPTSEDNKLWIDTGEVGESFTEITNEYSTSTGKGYSANYVNNILGNIQILSVQQVSLATSNLASQGNIQVQTSFTPVSEASGYLLAQKNNNWCIPTGVSVNTETNKVSGYLLNPFSTAKDCNCAFYVIAYKEV